jgi:hypothetical protein
MLVPDGVYLTETDPPYFRKVPAPTPAELQTLVQTISERIGRRLELSTSVVYGESVTSRTDGAIFSNARKLLIAFC